jgi:uroporphyrin-III C-methyltransferase / precorrin-2 dehydrogenase / sirohydrochlorin ferrochelatase
VLVGAGPGGDDLLTLAAVRELGLADVVLADRLVPPGARQHAPQADWVDVGKSPGSGVAQADINARIVHEARAGRRVVRLKGGDPLLFGRAAEEIEACRAADVPVRVVPGVTAASAAAAALARPLTDRDAWPWLAVVPGHEAEGSPRVPWSALARLGGTVAVYMGGRAASQVAQSLIRAGAPEDARVEVVADASRPTQAARETDLAGLAKRGAELDHPVVLLVRLRPGGR